MDTADGADLCADLHSLPVPSDSADAVAAIHVLEHFQIFDAPALISEWRRILKPGGKMIIEVPSLDKIINYIVWAFAHKEPLADFMTLHALYGDPRYRDPLMMHRWAYYAEVLRSLLEFVGMREIKEEPPRYHYPFRDMRFECIK